MVAYLNDSDFARLGNVSIWKTGRPSTDVSWWRGRRTARRRTAPPRSGGPRRRCGCGSRTTRTPRVSTCTARGLRWTGRTGRGVRRGCCLPRRRSACTRTVNSPARTRRGGYLRLPALLRKHVRWASRIRSTATTSRTRRLLP
jgi:hypothetical protein